MIAAPASILSSTTNFTLVHLTCYSHSLYSLMKYHCSLLYWGVISSSCEAPSHVCLYVYMG